MKVCLKSLLCLAGLLLLPATASTQSGADVHGDLFIGIWNPNQTRWFASTDVCIEGPSSDQPYRVTVTSANDPDRFELANDIDDRITYQLFWRGMDRPGQGEQLAPNAPSRRVHTRRHDCSRAASARINVRVSNRDIIAAPPGIYRDAIQVLISPI